MRVGFRIGCISSSSALMGQLLRPTRKYGVRSPYLLRVQIFSFQNWFLLSSGAPPPPLQAGPSPPAPLPPSHLTSNSTNNNFLRVFAIRSIGWTKIVLFNYRYWKSASVCNTGATWFRLLHAPQNHSVCSLIAQCTIFYPLTVMQRKKWVRNIFFGQIGIFTIKSTSSNLRGPRTGMSNVRIPQSNIRSTNSVNPNGLVFSDITRISGSSAPCVKIL